MASQMLNFRVRQEFVQALDAAAKTVGMNRSDFIRAAVERAVEGDEPVIIRRTTSPTRQKPVPKNECSHPKEALAKTAFGIKVCQVCGAKIA